jgi:CubicO group peptidase (beta-lactamase class C family)
MSRLTEARPEEIGLDRQRLEQAYQLLAARTVEMMTTNRLHDFPELPEPIRRTQPWGLGWRINHLASSDSWGDLVSPRAYGHTGATGTMVWIDHEANGFCVLFTSAIMERSERYLVQVSNAVASAMG